MTEGAVWLVIIGVLIALAAFLGKWTQSQQSAPQAQKKTKSEKAKRKAKAPPQPESPSVEAEDAPPVSKKDKKKQKKQVAKKAGPAGSGHQKAKPQEKKVQKKVGAGDKKGKSRDGGSGLPTITQQLAGRAEVKHEGKKKKKVDFSAFHPYFKKENKHREPAHYALQFGLLYKGTEYALEGCINDLKNVHEHFLHHEGFKHENTILMTDDTKETPTKRNMESSMKQFVDHSVKGDRLFIQYSGHGTEVKDTSGDEKDGFDEAICPLDGGVIVDDWLFFNVVNPLAKTGASLFVLVDACHSGTCLDLQNQYYATRGTHPSIRANIDKNVKRATDAHVIGFSAAMDNQTATDIQGDTIPQGAFTEMFLEVYRKHIKKPMSYKHFILEVDGLLAKAEYAQQASMSSSQKINLDHECRFWH